jgi:hypothetical protein
MKRISVVQAKKSLKKANEDRQYGHGSIDLFINCSADLMDLFAQYLESQMTVPPRKGAGSRVQKLHVELAYGRFYKAMRDFMDKEGEEDEQ